jgi:hypothetical protein
MILTVVEAYETAEAVMIGLKEVRSSVPRQHPWGTPPNTYREPRDKDQIVAEAEEPEPDEPVVVD